MMSKKMKERPAKYWVVVRGSRIKMVPGYWPPSKHIGKFVWDVDGSYYYWPQMMNHEQTGLSIPFPFPGWLLIAVGTELEKLNKK